MSSRQPISIIASTANDTGDLFAELVASFFSTVGYEQCRFNVHKSGREIDVDGNHRLESKRVIAECKATKAKIGGGDINKFVGALDAEKRKSNVETVGYFVSLCGYTETAIQQEKDLGGTRLLLLDWQDVLDGLIKGRIIVSETVAYAAAALCATAAPGLVADPDYEILAHPLGFLWAVYYTYGKKRTHVSFIHADGTPLHETFGQDILLSPKFCDKSLIYLPPIEAIGTAQGSVEEARQDYFAYLESECGVIQLEGLPADQEVGTRKLGLESIFVPSHLIASSPRKEARTSDVDAEDISEALSDGETGQTVALELSLDSKAKRRILAGNILSESKRIAILGLPGSGKSTLLKRLSTAYAFPKRMDLIDDSLPRQHRFPIFIRCRQLGEKVRDPILEILKDISKRIELAPNMAQAFSVLIEDSLRRGQALLLVDGLDEISDPGDRVAFVTQLRTFLHRYPAISLVVTSREAGFRIVGSALNTVCRHFILAEFDDADVMRLTLAWHKEVVGDRPDVAADAHELGAKICSIPRVRQLAGNPLLLTTLLLVRRWVGSLPTKRSVLYAKAIEVLLATWNVEGHAPLEQDEVVPQLEYLAFSMMRDGMQQIGLEPLRNLLIEAREAMPEILSYTKTSPGELIDRIELRSSLLMQSGVDVVDGVLMPVYEFRHLTFQEFLCAQAIVTSHYPGAKDSDTPLSVLTPYLNQESWQEAVLLTMVLAGKRTAPIVQELMERVSEELEPQRHRRQARTYGQLLLDALVDEIQLTPDLLRAALEKVMASEQVPTDSLANLYAGKYRDALLEVAQDCFFNRTGNLLRSGSVLVTMVGKDRGLALKRQQPFSEALAESLDLKLDVGEDSNWRDLAIDLLLVMEHAYLAAVPKLAKAERGPTPKEIEHLMLLTGKIRKYFTNPKLQIRATAIWAFNWLNDLASGLIDDPEEQMNAFFDQLIEEDDDEMRYLLAWAISTFDIVARDTRPFGALTESKRIFIEHALAHGKWNSMYKAQEKRAGLIAAYYLESRTDLELLNIVKETDHHFDRHLQQIMNLVQSNQQIVSNKMD